MKNFFLSFGFLFCLFSVVAHGKIDPPGAAQAYGEKQKVVINSPSKFRDGKFKDGKEPRFFSKKEIITAEVETPKHPENFSRLRPKIPGPF